jgi:hypothetical protein
MFLLLWRLIIVFFVSTQNANGYRLKQGEHLKERVLHASRPFAFKKLLERKIIERQERFVSVFFIFNSGWKSSKGHVALHPSAKRILRDPRKKSKFSSSENFTKESSSWESLTNGQSP